MKIVALFDFCETIVSTQTVGQFCRYYLKEGLSFSQKKIFFYRLVNLYRTQFGKDPIWFKFFDGLDMETLNHYAGKYAEHLYQEFLIQDIKEKIKWHLAQEHLVIIVSAGLFCYINCLAKNLGIEHVVAVDFVRTNQKIRGKLDENSYCYGEQKVPRLKDYLNKLNQKNIDWPNSFAYSDHPSDMPLLNLVGHRFVVQKSDAASSFSKEYLEQKEVQVIRYT